MKPHISHWIEPSAFTSVLFFSANVCGNIHKRLRFFDVVSEISTNGFVDFQKFPQTDLWISRNSTNGINFPQSVCGYSSEKQDLNVFSEKGFSYFLFDFPIFFSLRELLTKWKLEPGQLTSFYRKYQITVFGRSTKTRLLSCYGHDYLLENAENAARRAAKFFWEKIHKRKNPKKNTGS